MAKQCLEPISYRFLRRGKDWYLMATTDCSAAEVITNRKLGAIGVDLNAGFIAIAEVDRFGNPLGEHAISIAMYKRTSDQVAAALGDAVKEIVTIAKEAGKPIIIEDLDFSKKKLLLRENGKGYARMLSSFCYSKFKAMLLARAAREGVEVIAVNPFATSLIGQVKFMGRYRLSSHGAAAVAIARRGMNFKDKRPKINIMKLPAYARHLSSWKCWSLALKSIKKKYTFKERLALLYKAS